MRERAAWWTAGVIAGGLVAPAVAAAEGAGAADLKAAAAAAKDGKRAEAAALYGRAIAAMQRIGDPVAEQDAVEGLVRLRRGRDDRPVLAAAMDELNPTRLGALVSAPLLAGEILLDAALKGDDAHVKDATAVIEAAAKGGKSGAWIAALSRLAAGMREARGGDAAKAADHLEAARRAGNGEGWTDLAVLAGAELLAVRLAAGDAERALAEMKEMSAAVPPDGETRHLNLLTKLLGERFKGAPEAVRKVLEDRFYSESAKGVPGAPGAPGGDGRDLGGPARSPLGDALRSHPKSKPLATATRGDAGFEVGLAWSPKVRGKVDPPRGTAHFDRDGLTLAFAEGSVALRRMDPTGREGERGADGEPNAFRAFHPLARGETWNLFRDGTVTITSK